MAPARILQKPSINPPAEMVPLRRAMSQENDRRAREARFPPRHRIPAFKVFHGSAIGAAIRPGAGKASVPWWSQVFRSPGSHARNAGDNRSMKIRVECYSGAKADERSVR